MKSYLRGPVRFVRGLGTSAASLAMKSSGFNWDESTFTTRMAGSAIYRIGYKKWLSNIAIALGNAHTTDDIVSSLKTRLDDASPMLREHVRWALEQHSIESQ